MKQLTAVLVGAGDRGGIYAEYSIMEPEELKIVAVVEPNELRRRLAGERYGLDESRWYASVDEFLADKVACDFVINATMDQQHYETAAPLLAAGYHMLLEKPIVNNREQLLDLQRLAHENNVYVSICHVLRYAPFYKTIKEMILDGAVGDIMTMEMNEHVGIAHFIDSFVRGKWNSEAKCGSGFLLAKSCHDMDLACWLNNASTPTRVMSVGSRSLFIPERAPEGATEFCYQCPHNDTCLYSAQKIHLELDKFAFQTWIGIGKPVEDVTYEEKEEFLKHDNYGRCAYNVGGDINDRQVVNIEFANGSIVTFTMAGGSPLAGRDIHIVGTKGEIRGNIDYGYFYLRQFNRDTFTNEVTKVDVTKKVVASKYVGHGGGDYAIMHEWVRFLNGDRSSVSITGLDDSINSHLVAYAADESNHTNKAVYI